MNTICYSQAADEAAVLKMVGLSKSQLQKLLAVGAFPQPNDAGAWESSKIARWIIRQPAVLLLVSAARDPTNKTLRARARIAQQFAPPAEVALILREANARLAAAERLAHKHRPKIPTIGEVR